MTLQLTINGVDFTTKWRPYESSWTARAYLGQTIQSSFVIDDDDGTIDHLNLASRKIVEVWENASGSNKCLYRGRVANKTLGRGMQRTEAAMRWIINAEDYNVDFSGIRVDDSERPAETDRVRVLAYRTSYLNGAASTNANARDSTELGTAFVINADLVTLPAETYTDTSPGEVLHRICEISGKNFFAFVDDAGDGQLYYADFADTSYLSDITVTDAGSVDGINTYPPYISTSSGEHEGQSVITGGSIRFGSNQFVEESDVAGGETFHDKWEEHFQDEYIEDAATAEAFIEKMVHSRSNEQFTYTSTIDMWAENAHRIKAGMMVPLRLVSANKPTIGNQRAVQVTHEPVAPDRFGHTRYRVTIEFNVPRGKVLRRHIRRKPGPFPPAPPTAGSSTRLYPSAHLASGTETAESTASPNLNGAHQDAAWEFASGSMDYWQLYNTPANSTTGNTTSWSAVNAAVGDVAHAGFVKILAGSLLATVQSGGTYRAQFRTNARSGIGVDEGAQGHYTNLCIRIYRPSTTSFIGTAVAVGHSIGAANWPAQNTPRINRKWTGTLSAVAGAIAGDYLVVDVGNRHTSPTSGATGSGLFWDDTSGTDLPEDETESSALNSWIELSGSGTGDTPSPTVNPGDESIGDDDNCYALCGHSHAHGFHADDGIHFHDADQIDGIEAATGGVAWFNVKSYGALGDGTTDDAAAINLAIDALNASATGGGVLYFPTGDYLCASGLTAITVPCRILGDGAAGGGTSFSTYSSRVVCSSGTAVLFTIQAHAYSFEGLAIMNNQSTPSAGAGIAVTANGDHGQFRHITVEGFYINIDIQEGAEWRMAGCHLLGPELYALKIRHVDLPDGGDWAISDSWFTADGTNATAAIWQESGGGGKIVNVKINKRTNTFTDGIHVAITNVNTSILEISNTSIENVTGDAVDISTVGTATFSQVVLDGLQVGLYGNNTGRAVKITAAAAGGTAVAGGLSGVSIDGLVAKTDGTARAAVELTNVDVATLGEMTLLGFNARYTQSGSTNITDSGAGGAAALDDLTDVTLTSPAEGDMLRFDGTAWVDTPGRWEPVTTNPGGGPELVWDGDELLMTWVNT